MSLTIASVPTPLVIHSDGVILVQGTRVPLDTVVLEFQQGATVEEIVEQYTSLDLADVYAVIAYYLRNKSDVENYLQLRQQQAQQIREENERRFPSQGLRARLLARREMRDRSHEST